MCGFAGLISNKIKNENLENFSKNLKDSLDHRGPDSNGFYIEQDKGIVLTHNRLSILDLTKEGNQPMFSTCKNYLILFNGEIYNHLELRATVGKNHKWSGTSDTETLLYYILNFGLEETLKRIRGMFSFALYDLKNDRIILARDIAGEKPLYYGFNDGIFFFASEIKALKNLNFLKFKNRDIEIKNYFQFGYTTDSIYQDQHKLDPASLIIFDLNNYKILSKKKYWTIPKIQNSNKTDKNDYSKKFELLIKEAVKEQMISDVPLGAFLSGGVDSSLIVSLMKNFNNNKIKTFSIGFDDDKYSEIKYAEKVSKILNTDHTSLVLNKDDAPKIIDKLISNMDEPFADGSIIPTYAVSRLAKKSVKVVLTGDGADELFGGYTRYSQTINFMNRLKRIPKFMFYLSNFFLNNLNLKKNFNSHKIHKLGSISKNNSIENVYKQYLSQNIPELIFKDNFLKKIKEYSINEKKELSFDQMIMQFDFDNYLPNDILKKVDFCSMLCSLEARAPFLDRRIIDFSYNLPKNLKFNDKENKIILRQMLYKFLPKDLFDRPKQGFGIPIRYWLSTSLRDWAEDLLKNNDKSLDFINFNYLKKEWKKYLEGDDKINNSFIWNNLVYLAWIKKHNTN